MPSSDILGFTRVKTPDSQRSFNLVVGGCQRHSSGQGFDPQLGVKKIQLANSTQNTWSRPGQSSWATGPCVRVGKAHVPKHKLRTGTWVVLTGDGPLCMGGCGVRGVFSACVRRLLLNIKPWGWSFPYRSSFFKKKHQTTQPLPHKREATNDVFMLILQA
jgi:hypothetical protein